MRPFTCCAARPCQNPQWRATSLFVRVLCSHPTAGPIGSTGFCGGQCCAGRCIHDYATDTSSCLTSRPSPPPSLPANLPPCALSFSCTLRRRMAYVDAYLHFRARSGCVARRCCNIVSWRVSTHTTVRLLLRRRMMLMVRGYRALVTRYTSTECGPVLH
jgi:hypothetical protein